MKIFIPHPLDILLGMEIYVTRSKPLKYFRVMRPRGFYVFEISNRGYVVNENLKLTSSKGPLTLYVLKKEGIDTLTAIRIIKKILRTHKIGYAGLKDKDAITYQLVSVDCEKPPQIIKTERIELIMIGKDYKHVRIGDLWGNKFLIITEVLDGSNVVEAIQEVMNVGELPAFFGYQRFGTRRPITHIIGKFILRKEWDLALEYLLGHPYPTETQISQKARYLFKEGSLKEAHELFVKAGLLYEAKVLKKYMETKKSFKALQILPRALLRLFINAYQSYIFNKLISKLWREFGTLKQDIGGLRKINDYTLAPIPGLRFRGCRSYVCKIIKELLHADAIDFDMFKISELHIKALGTWRPTTMKIHNLRYELKDKELKLSFALEKGMYATVVLREICKCDPLNL
ncbi:MAG: tRNA pseudouridine(13) synthase TruD [Thermoprotei archaeon]|nr:MAG: tRNA pseudouridine(13) synthase TruD [Thermoprotei archaeon]